MKRFLNLHDVGIKMISAIGVFVIGIPSVGYGLSILLGAWGIQWAVLKRLIFGSLLVGGVLFALLLALIIAEQIQDHLLYRMYRKSLGKRIRGRGNVLECPYCGNRNVQEFEHTCRVCGKMLH